MEELVTLWKHQRTGVDLALKSWQDGWPSFAYFMEQGTGKTGTTITLMREIYTAHKRPLKTLILCPAIVVKNWQREFGRFSQCERFVQVLTGTKAQRINAMENGERAGKKIFVTNLETLATVQGLLWDEKQRGKDKVRFPVDRGWECVIFDEIHRLKNGSAKSTKLAIKLADNVFFKFGLTGTPIANNEMDLWAIFRLLDGGKTFGKSFQAFRREWFIDENAGMPTARYFPSWKIRPGSSEKMKALVYQHAMRVEKHECLDLPPLVKSTIEVELSPEQRRHYEEMRRDFITYLDSGACTAQMAVTKALRLQQIASGFLKLEDGREIRFEGTPRLNAVAELLEDHPGKLIIWASFKENYQALAKICEKAGRSYAFITGEQSAKQKDEAEASFTKGETSVLIANPSAGGTGVNLVEADMAVWYSRSFKATDRWQAMARNHRGGSEMHQTVYMVDLCAVDTIDEHVLAALDKKEAIAESILSWRARV